MEQRHSSTRYFTMTHRDLDGRGRARHYGRWPEQWRSEDDRGPITATAVFVIILTGLIVYGAVMHL